MKKVALLLCTLTCIACLFTTALGCASQSSSAFTTCRDLIFCHPSDNGSSENKFAKDTASAAKEQNLTVLEYLRRNCCDRGGGEVLTETNPVVKRIVCEEQASPISNFQRKRSPAQRALYWIAADDAYEISKDSLRLVQRYALAVLFYHFAGSYPSHWKSCHDSDCDHFLGGEAWLSPIQECQWAFVECDRNDIVTGIFMRKCYALLIVFFLHIIGESTLIALKVGPSL